MDNIESFDDDSVSVISEDWTSDFRTRQMRKDLIARIIKNCGVDDGRNRPRHVAVIGIHGVGKSSFINTLAAALNGERWREFAFSGSHGDRSGGVTVITKSFKKCGLSNTTEYREYQNVLLPTLIDFAGFDNQNTEVYTELLRIVFYGCLPENQSLAQAEELYREEGLQGLRAVYSEQNEKLKVDRIIFVTPATVEVPSDIIDCVLKAARPLGTRADPRSRTISIFGVMTKYDRVGKTDGIQKEKYDEREKLFIDALGLRGSNHRFLRCSNYCNDVDADNERLNAVFPHIDLPVLKFFAVVTDPNYDALNAEETYVDGQPEPEVDFTIPGTTTAPQTRRRLIGGQRGQQTERGKTARADSNKRASDNSSQLIERMLPILLLAFEIIVITFCVWWLSKPVVDTVKLRTVCKFSDHYHTDNDEFKDLCREFEDREFCHGLKFYIVLLVLTATRITFSLGHWFPNLCQNIKHFVANVVDRVN